MYEGRIDTWDYQWTLALWSQGMLAVLPDVNLISNIGFSLDATHTHGSSSIYADMKVSPMIFPLRHPEIVLPHHQADNFTSQGMFTNAPLSHRILQKVRSLIRGGR